VVDDSVVVRRLVTDALSSDPAIEVVGIAANGQIAQNKVEQLQPDLVTMDIEMPVCDGIEAVRTLRRTGFRRPIVMFSTLTERGASATLDALAAGADDYVTKPANVGSVQQALAQVAGELIPRIKALVPVPAGTPTGLASSAGGAAVTGAGAAGDGPRRGAATAAGAFLPRPATRPRAAVVLRPAPAARRPVRAVVLGSSTGGPEALSRVLGGLGEALPVPVVVVQHMPPVFTRQLAARLDRLGPSTVLEAAGGELLQPGHVYIAPGDHHLVLERAAAGARTRLSDAPPVNYCRPAVDVLFRSAVDVLGGDLLAVVLTGMGADGRSGCDAVVEAGGTVLVQDEPTSVVWGMPGAVATAGLAHAVVPVDGVAAAVTRAVAAVGAAGPAGTAAAAQAGGGAR
jgi:two-component system chemotaxis response regulator CheB